MEYAIEMLNITKEFPGIKANDNVTVQVKQGEIHALLGENGAGKSTLMSVLFGLYQPEEGIIKINGKEENIANPNVANRLGIGMVHQHFKLVHNFTVTQNIILGVEPLKKGFLDVNSSIGEIEELSKKYGLEIDPNSKIEDITVGMQQRVEILKMLYRHNDILIFDEPTAVLTPQEIEQLMDIIRQFSKEGKTVIIITHKLDEIKAIADSCTILRKGKSIKTVDVSKTSKEQLAELMVGRAVKFEVDKEKAKPTSVALSVNNLNSVDSNGIARLKDISFEAKKGEILTIAGIDGNGQTELVYALTGLLRNYTGEIYLNEELISDLSIRERTIRGLGHIPEDRHKHGLVLDFDVANNMVLQQYFEDRFQSKGFLKFKEIYDYSDSLIEMFDVRSGEGSKSPARGLSGGNQQKAIVAREISRDPDVLIAVQPTRGLDVGAIEFIHKRLIEHRDAGKSVVLVSLELEEVLNVSDRILVMFEGEIVAELSGENADRNEIGLYMSGSKRSDK